MSEEQFMQGMLLSRSSRREGLLPVTETMVGEYPIEALRYSPTLILSQARNFGAAEVPSHSAGHAVYRLTLNGSEVDLVIDRKSFLLDRVIVTRFDDLLGDVTNTVRYADYATFRGLHYATAITVETLRNVTDDVQVSDPEFLPAISPLIEPPPGFAPEPTAEDAPTAVTSRVSDHVYAVELMPADSRAALIEFSDFFVALDVPLASRYGELVIAEARRIDPAKPIRYYGFGHHHPWAIGGVRPFVRIGATILAREEQVEYLRSIVDAPHSLRPDSLFLHPKPLRLSLLDTCPVITDGTLELRAVHIGNTSRHTEDYSVYYLPQDRMVFDGDLTWIPKEKPVEKASGREKGLYDAIRREGLNVDHIFQHWPLPESHGLYSLLPFAKLEEAAQMADD